MPQNRPQDRPHRRKHSRSLSPVPAKHKRSWQNDTANRSSRGLHRSPSPRMGKKHSSGLRKSPPSFPSRRDRLGSPGFRGPLRRSPSPLPPRKRPLSRSPDTGRRGPPSPGTRPLRDAPPPRRDSRGGNLPLPRSGPPPQRQRSMSPRPGKKTGHDRMKPESFYSKRSPTPPGQRYSKKRRFSGSPPLPPPAQSSSHHHHSASAKIGSKGRRSLSPRPSPPPLSGPEYRPGPATTKRGDSLPQRRVSSSGKKKMTRLTLHKRFTTEDQPKFHLEENVTIAILRNPNAEPSEDVTVKRVFDSSLFKMIHKKSEGRRPIFDREEIKVWRHDENLADDPDYERRLVRVKSSAQTSGSGKKPASDSLSRMSPDVIRKAFGLQVGRRSKSRSPHKEPQIRLDPRPDPRYESKYRQQVEKEERRRSDAGPSSRDKEKRKSSVGREDETYDLRHALDRRRSDREDSSFRVELHRDEGKSSDSRGRPVSPEFGGRRQVVSGGGGDGRNVIFGNRGDDRGGDRYSSLSPDREGGHGWEVDRNGRAFRGRVKVRGRGRGARGRRPDWSPEHRDGEGYRSHSAERKPRYSHSPPNSRGWRGNRGGRGRGRGRDFGSPYREKIVSPNEIDDSFKYTQHDDRDVSPKLYRGRGGRGRGRFPARSFGSNNFHGTRGGYRGRVFRGKSFGAIRDRDHRSSDRARDRSSDREWKHDMYDSLQTEEEQPHSTTINS